MCFIGGTRLEIKHASFQPITFLGGHYWLSRDTRTYTSRVSDRSVIRGQSVGPYPELQKVFRRQIATENPFVFAFRQFQCHQAMEMP